MVEFGSFMARLLRESLIRCTYFAIVALRAALEEENAAKDIANNCNSAASEWILVSGCKRARLSIDR
jgi:Protein of unknown function (DUF3632)